MNKLLLALIFCIGYIANGFIDAPIVPAHKEVASISYYDQKSDYDLKKTVKRS